MTEQFKYLLTPLKVGPVTIRNRVMSVGHGTHMAIDGMPSDQMARYHADRAKGGVGLIDMELALVHPETVLFPNMNRIDDDKYIPGFKLVADMVHENGAKIVSQIGHFGRNADSLVSERPLWSSSSVPCPVNREMPKAMEIEEIKEMISAYAEAARRMKEAGLDGVTLHSSYGSYGINQFISPYANKRTDEYGGSLENRLRFLMEIIEAIRDKVGDDFMLGMQLSADEFTPTGLKLPDYQDIARRIDATRKIDYIIVKGGTYLCRNLLVPDMQHPAGFLVPLAASIKEVVSTAKIVAQGRINDPVLAEKVLADGQGDIIGMTRQQLCDPETVKKVQEGRLDDVKACISCNQGCVNVLFGGRRHITCIQNPGAGKEKQLGLGTYKMAEKRKKIMVIGGGPAGMKTAEKATRIGHEVTLYEKRKELGGQVRIAAKASGRDEFGNTTRWLENQIKKLGVKINLGVEVTAEMVLKESPDVVVVASGSSPTRTLIGLISHGIEKIPGLDQDNILDTWQVLEDSKEVGERVLVVDDGEGTWKGVSVAETLADRGKTVEIITPLPFVGVSIDEPSRGPMFARLFKKNIKLSPFTTVTGISGKTVSVISQGKLKKIDVDTVVLAGWHKPNEDIYFALKGKVKKLQRVGDCIASRTVLEAIREGEAAGRLA